MRRPDPRTPAESLLASRLAAGLASRLAACAASCVASGLASCLAGGILAGCLANPGAGDPRGTLDPTLEPGGRITPAPTGATGPTGPTGGPDAGTNPEPDPCASPPDPGRVTLHRLNRAEYNNTVRDLLGDTTRPADDFPADDHGYGFDNIADVLAMSPLLVEKLEIAADNLIAEALRPAIGPLTTRYQAEAIGSDVGARHGTTAWNLWSNGALTQSFAVAVPGQYELSARAYGQQAGPEPARMSFRLDAMALQTFDVTEVEASPGTFRRTVSVGAGGHSFSVEFVNDYYQPNNPDPRQRDRNLIVDWLEIRGPLDAPAPNPEIRARLLICDPATAGRDACGRSILTAFARRAWRRPIDQTESDRLLALATVAWSEGDDFETGLRLAMKAVLFSPSFLFRVEIDPDLGSPDPHPLAEHELAARLSYFLWSSTPDDALLDAADRGDLSDRVKLRAEVDRMLADPKASALVDNFGGQWLYTRALDNVNPDYAVFPDFDDELKDAMAEETRLLFSTFLHDDLSALDMLDARFTFVNDRLARHYGMPPVGGSNHRRVALTSTSPRGGIFGQGSILTVTSYPKRTSPVRRGKWVLEQILCTHPRPPPPGVEGLPEPPNPTGTLRQRFEAHRSNEVCRGCHESMDPIGFGLENFDGVGAWRETDNDLPVDASGVLPGERSFTGPRELAQHIKADPLAPWCMTERMLTYATGRGMEDADRCTIDQLTERFRDRGYRFSELVQTIATSGPFTMRRAETSTTTGGGR